MEDEEEEDDEEGEGGEEGEGACSEIPTTRAGSTAMKDGGCVLAALTSVADVLAEAEGK